VAGVSGFVFVAVMLALAWALWRRPARADTRPDAEPAPGLRAPRLEDGRGRRSAVGHAPGVAARVEHRHRSCARAGCALKDAVNIRVVAHQWWWQVIYDDPKPDRIFQTANEILVPVGRPVQVTLESDDVIHSFWVPSLHGKKDLIPGRPATIRSPPSARDAIAGSAPSSAGCSMPIWRSKCAAVAAGEFEPGRMRSASRRPNPG
jgi:cytochrome c oxidase subunit 2